MNLATAFVELRVDSQKGIADAKREIAKIGDQKTTVKVGLDSAAAKKGAGDVGKEIDKLEAKGKSASTNLTKQFAQIFGAAAFIGGVKKSIDAASDLNETVSKTQVIFGSAGDAVVKFASSSATQFGLSKRAALDALSTFATFGKGAGLAGTDLSGFSEKLVGLSADLASFYNTSPEEAIGAIGAALRGESEPIRQYGVLLDDVTLKARALSLGLYDGTGVLDQHSKVLAAQAEILAQTSDAQGDFARTSDGLANSQRIAAAQAENSAASLGQALLPVYKEVVKVVGALAEGFGQLPAPVQTAIVALVGVVALAGPIEKVVDVAKSLTKAITSIGASGAGLGGISAAIAGTAGIIGVALTAYSLLSDQKAEATKTTKDFTAALIAETGGQKGALQAALASKFLELNNEGFTGLLDTLHKLGLSEADLADAIMGKTVPAFDAAFGVISAARGGAASYTEADKNLAKSLGITSGEANNFFAAYVELADGFAGATSAAKLSDEVTKSLAGTTSDAVKPTEDLAKATTATAGSREHMALATYTAARAEAEAKAAADASKKAVDALKASVDNSTTSYDRLATAASTLKSAIDAVFGGTLSLEDANRAYNESVDKLGTSLKTNGKSLDVSTEKGRNNRQAIEDQVKAILDYGVAAAGSGDTNEEAAGKVAYLTQGLKDQLRAAGLTQQQVDDYLTTLGLTPENVTTTIAVANDEATKARIKPLIEQLGKVDAGAVAEVQALIDRGEFDEAERRLKILLGLVQQVRQSDLANAVGPYGKNDAAHANAGEAFRTRGSATATADSFTGDARASAAELDDVASRLSKLSGLTERLSAANEEVAKNEGYITEARQQGDKEAEAIYQDRLSQARTSAKLTSDELDREDQRVGAMYRSGELSAEAYFKYIQSRSSADEKYSVEWEQHQNQLQDILDTAEKARADKADAAARAAADLLAAQQKAEEDATRAHVARLAAIFDEARAQQTLAETTAQANKDYDAFDRASVRNYLTSINPKASAADRADAAQAFQDAQDQFAKSLLARARATAIAQGNPDGTQGFADSVRSALEQDKRNAPVLTNEIDTLLLGVPNFNGASSTGFSGVSAASKSGGATRTEGGGDTYIVFNSPGVPSVDDISAGIKLARLS